jgi:predicted RNA-binding Zn-ribbon protein involved in translation (DUF1610 family)
LIARTFCLSCGAELPSWFDCGEDPDREDEAYERWLDSPCPDCGKTPRQNGAK